MNRKKIAKILKNEDGAGLVLALMVLMVLAVLGVAVAAVTIGSHKLGHISRDSNSAYYIAEAGANLAYKEIENGVMPAYDDSTNDGIYFGNINDLTIPFKTGKVYGSGFFEPQFGDQPTATVTINGPENVSGKVQYEIVSIGEISGKTRTVRKPFTVNWVKKNSGIGLPKLPDDCAMYIGKSLVPLTVKVYGDIITHPNYTLLKKAFFLTAIEHYKAGSTTQKNTIKYEPLNMQPYYDLEGAFPDLPRNYEQYDEEKNVDSSKKNVISANSGNDILRIGELTVSSGNPLTIDTGDEERTINLVVKKLRVYSDINIIGNGTVNLFVTEYMDFTNISSGLNIGGATVDQLNILYSGNSSASFIKLTHATNRSIVFTGTIFLKKADLYFYNNVKLEGIIITFGSSLVMAENVQVTASIYAPKSSVHAWVRSQLKGTLVADTVTFLGNNKVEYYLNDYLQTYPYGTGTAETPDLEELIFTQAAIEP